LSLSQRSNQVVLDWKSRWACQVEGRDGPLWTEIWNWPLWGWVVSDRGSRWDGQDQRLSQQLRCIKHVEGQEGLLWA